MTLPSMPAKMVGEQRDGEDREYTEEAVSRALCDIRPALWSLFARKTFQFREVRL